MSQTITGTYTTGVTLTAQDTTIASTARLTTGPGVNFALYGTLNTSTGLTLTNFGTLIGSNFEDVVFNNNYADQAAAGTINNESGGLIDGSGGYGVLSYGPAVVENAAGGTISGSVYAIGIEGDPSSVINDGLVQSGNVGILEIGESISSTSTISVENLAGGTITGSVYGIFLETAHDELVDNEAGGTINGEVVLDSGGTVTNAGVINHDSNGTIAVSFETSNAPIRLIVDPGAVFSGDIEASSSNASNTIELAKCSGAVGTLDGFGSTITNFNTIVFDSGAEWAISSSRTGLDNAAVTGFVDGDTINLSGVPTTDVSVAYAADQGTVTVAGGGSFSIAGTFPDLYAKSDGAGGTSVIVAPLVTADTANPATGDYTVGKVVGFTLTTNETVTVTGAPTLTLNDGGTAAYTGPTGTPTSSLTFSTTVAAGQNAETLQATGVALPNGATIRDGAGTDAVLTGADATFSGLEVDTAAPTVSSPTLMVQQNAGPTPIGIAAPSDNLSAASGIGITAGMLPTDGIVTLADGTTPVTAGESLTAAQLTGLLFTPTPGVYSQGSAFTFGLADGAGNTSRGTAALDVSGPGAPTISGTHASTTVAEAPVAPFSGVTLSDPSAGTDTLTISLASGGGALADGSGFSGLASSNDAYTLSGTAAAVTAELDALVFTSSAPPPGTSATTSLVLSYATSAGTSTTDAGTAVTDASAPAPITPPHGADGPALSFNPEVSFQAPTKAVLTGTVFAANGVASLEAYATSAASGGTIDIGSANVNPDGTWNIVDDNGPDTQTNIFGVATDGAGNVTTVGAPYDVQAGVRGEPYKDVVNQYAPGGIFTGQTFFNRDGSVYQTSTYATLPNGHVAYTYSGGSAFAGASYSSYTDTYRPDGTLLNEVVNENDGTHVITALTNGQTLDSINDDLFNGPGKDETFHLAPGFGTDKIDDFAAGGANQDTIALAKADFGTVEVVLADTTERHGHAVIADPVSGDTVALVGVTKAELVSHPSAIHLFR